MKITNGEIWLSREAMEKLCALEFPVKTSLDLARLSRKLTEESIPINTSRDNLIKKYGEIQDGTGQVTIIAPNQEGKPVSPNWDKFIQELQELFNLETEITINKVRLPSEVDGKPIQIEPNILILLEPFIEAE